MRLTNYIRDAFVSAAMADVPKADYEQQIRDLANKLIQAELKKLGLDQVDPPRLCSHCRYFGGVYMEVRGLHYKDSEKLAADPRFEALAVKWQAQKEQRQALESKLNGIAAGCTTLKQLAKLLPEFEKYLPKEEAKGTNLPMVSNVVGDFIRAGWPKDQKKTKVSSAVAA